MQLGSGGAVNPLPPAGPGQGHPGGQGKFDFPRNYSKGHRLAYYLFIFHVIFGAV